MNKTAQMATRRQLPSSRPAAFSLAELLLAVAILATALLLLVGTALSVLKGTQKTTTSPAGDVAANTILTLLLEPIRTDTTTPHSAAWTTFWTTPTLTPWKAGSFPMNHTTFNYSVDAETLEYAPTGNPLGDPTNADTNRLKLVTITVTWWDGASGTRQGVGNLKASLTRVVHQANDD